MTASIVNDHARPVDIIGYDCGWGCANFGCEDGPAHAPVDQIMASLRQNGFAPRWQGPLGIKFLGHHGDLQDKHATLPLVTEALSRLSAATARSAAAGHLPLVIGGDHSSAIGTWSGIIAARAQAQRFGMIWIDAHMDCHTYETSHQGKWGGWWHGQPLTALHGYGLDAFRHLHGTGAKLSAQHTTLIGIHSFEPAEEDFARRHGIRVITLDEVKQRGFASAYAEAHRRATTGTDGWGMTIDLDAFHPDAAPGVGTDESDGLWPDEVLPILRGCAVENDFSGLEIAEFNPHRDRNHKTAHLIEKLVGNIFTTTVTMRHNNR